MTQATGNTFPTYSFPTYSFPTYTWPGLFTAFGYAEIWDSSVVMNLSISGNVVMNREINMPDYSELEDI